MRPKYPPRLSEPSLLTFTRQSARPVKRSLIATLGRRGSGSKHAKPNTNSDVLVKTTTHCVGNILRVAGCTDRCRSHNHLRKSKAGRQNLARHVHCSFYWDDGSSGGCDQVDSRFAQSREAEASFGV